MLVPFLILTTKPSLVRSCSAWGCGMVTTLGTETGLAEPEGLAVGVGVPVLITKDTVLPRATSVLAAGLWLIT